MTKKKIMSKSNNLDKTVRSFSHEIKNPLHSASINLEVLRTRLSRSSVGESKELLKHADIVDRDLKKIQNIIETFLQNIGT